MKDLLKSSLFAIGFFLVFVGFFSQYFLLAIGVALAIFSIMISEKGHETKKTGIIGMILMAPGLYLIKTSSAISLSMLILRGISSNFSISYPSSMAIVFNPWIVLLMGISGLVISEFSLGMLYRFLPKKKEALMGIYLCAAGCVLAFIGLGFAVINIASTVIISAGLLAITISLSLDIIEEVEVKSFEEDSRKFSKGFYWGIPGQKQIYFLRQQSQKRRI